LHQNKGDLTMGQIESKNTSAELTEEDLKKAAGGVNMSGDSDTPKYPLTGCLYFTNHLDKNTCKQPSCLRLISGVMHQCSCLGTRCFDKKHKPH